MATSLHLHRMPSAPGFHVRPEWRSPEEEWICQKHQTSPNKSQTYSTISEYQHTGDTQQMAFSLPDLISCGLDSNIYYLILFSSPQVLTPHLTPLLQQASSSHGKTDWKQEILQLKLCQKSSKKDSFEIFHGKIFPIFSNCANIFLWKLWFPMSRARSTSHFFGRSRMAATVAWRNASQPDLATK